MNVFLRKEAKTSLMQLLISERPKNSRQSYLIGKDVARETEVVNLNGILLAQQDVLALEVAVHDVHLVHVLDAGAELAEVPHEVGLLDVAAQPDKLEQIAAAAPLQREVELVSELEELEEPVPEPGI